MALKLFILEFRRALFSYLIFVVGAGGACRLAEMVIQHFQKTPSFVHESLNLLVVITIAIYGFPCGSRAFSAEFKDTSYLFLQSLPLERERAWLALVLANLSASLLSILVLIGLRPSVLTALPEGYVPQVALAVALIAYFILFCTGCCFSLLFRKVVLNYLAGLFVCAIVFLEIILEMFFRNSSDFYDYTGAPTSDFALMLTTWLLVCLAFLTLSMRFFASGEFNMSKVQLRSSSKIVASMIVLFLLIGIAEGSGLFAVHDPWITWRWWQRVPAEVSFDGKYLLVPERRERHSYIVRRNIIDVPTGKVAGRIEEVGPSNARWSLRDDSLNMIVAVESPLLRLGYVLPESTKLLALSPQGELLSHHLLVFSRIVATLEMEDGRTLLVAKEGNEGTILEYDGRSGNLRELATGRLTGSPWISRVPGGYLVRFTNESEPSRVWLVGTEISELRWAPTKTREFGIPCVIEGTFYSEPRECQSELARRFPFTSKPGSHTKPGRHGFYLVRDVVTEEGWWSTSYLTPSSIILYLDTDSGIRSGNLFAFDRSRQSWRLLAEDKLIDRRYAIAAQSASILWPSELETLDSSEGVATYTVEKDAMIRSYLYDANLDRTIVLGMVAKPSPPAQSMLTLRRFRGMKGLAVFFGEGDYRTYTGNLWLYIPGSGVIRKLPHPVDAGPEKVLHMDDQGNLIYARDDADPASIYYLSADGAERQLWPLKP